MGNFQAGNLELSKPRYTYGLVVLRIHLRYVRFLPNLRAL